jgi:hypothetical protein
LIFSFLEALNTTAILWRTNSNWIACAAMKRELRAILLPDNGSCKDL